MNAVERAAEVMHRSGRAKSRCGDGCPFPDCCYSDMEEEDQARALADAGLLVTDADRAVLDAAKREADAHARETIGGVPAPIRCKCHLCLAVRARREAQT